MFVAFSEPPERRHEAGKYAAVIVREHEAFGVEPDGTSVVIAFRNDDGWWVPCGLTGAFPDITVSAA